MAKQKTKYKYIIVCPNLYCDAEFRMFEKYDEAYEYFLEQKKDIKKNRLNKDIYLTEIKKFYEAD